MGGILFLFKSFYVESLGTIVNEAFTVHSLIVAGEVRHNILRLRFFKPNVEIIKNFAFVLMLMDMC